MTLYRVSPDDVRGMCQLAKDNARIKLEEQTKELLKRFQGRSKFHRWFYGFTDAWDGLFREHDWVVRRAEMIHNQTDISSDVFLDEDDAAFLSHHQRKAQRLSQEFVTPNIQAVDS